MTLFAVGALMIAISIGIIFYVRDLEDSKLQRAHVVSAQHILLSNFVLALIIGDGALMALSVF